MLFRSPGMRGTPADVGDPAALQRAVAEAAAWLGDISVLVNNVGIGGPRAAVEDIALADWQRTLDVNVTAMFIAMQAVIPGMKRRGGGVIVNFSTGSTRTRLPHRTAYVVSKFAVEGLTLNAARELGPHNIRVNAILPGIVEGPRMTGVIAARAKQTSVSFEAMEKTYLDRVSLRRMVTAGDVAATVAYLLSPAGRNISGQSLGVDGNVEVL